MSLDNRLIAGVGAVKFTFVLQYKTAQTCMKTGVSRTQRFPPPRRLSYVITNYDLPELLVQQLFGNVKEWQPGIGVVHEASNAYLAWPAESLVIDNKMVRRFIRWF